VTIDPFKLERYFAQFEFKVKYLLSSSDPESLSMEELLQMASSESLMLWKTLKLGYTESAGHPVLRSEASNLYQNITPDDLIISAPEEAIFIAMQTILSPGDNVIVVSPAYQSLYEIARSIGCSVTPWKFELGSNGWQLDIDQLEHSLIAQTRLIVVNFPHNPTGYVPSIAEYGKIVDIARRNGIYLFSDEMYRFLEYDSTKRLPPVCDIYEKGITLSGLSKSFALPGLRMGWLATQEHALIEKWLVFKDYTTICNSAPSEILGIIALRAKEKILNRNLAIIQKNLTLADQFFSKYEDRFKWIRPVAGSVGFPKWLGKGTIEAFCQELLEQKGIMIVPGSIFEFPGSHFRIGLGRMNFGEILDHTDDYLKSRYS